MFDKYMFDLYQWLRYHTSPYLVNPNKIFDILIESQYWSRSKLEEYQVGFINELINTAKKSKYYQELYRDINFPITSVTEISQLPIVTKNDLQINYERFATGEYLKNGWRGSSSGSTGKPTLFYLSQSAMASRAAIRRRIATWWDFSPNDRNVSFTGFPRKTDSLKNKAKYKISQKIDVNIFSMNESTISGIFYTIFTFKPVYIRGYVSAIVHFTKLAKSKNINLSRLNLTCIIVTSEILYDSDRKTIEDAFQTKVVNEYGAAEVGLIAFECPQGGMHVQEDCVIVDVDNNNELISTELHNNLMPLINYKVGDKVILSEKKCICGRELRLIKSIEGRVGSDDILTPDGRVLNYLFFDGMIKKLGNNQISQIKKFQIVQNGKLFTCYIVKNSNYSQNIENYFTNYIKQGIGDQVDVQIVYKEDIEPEKSGKYRIFKRIIQ